MHIAAPQYKISQLDRTAGFFLVSASKIFLSNKTGKSFDDGIQARFSFDNRHGRDWVLRIASSAHKFQKPPQRLRPDLRDIKNK
jgi:hypothetical protein